MRLSAPYFQYAIFEPRHGSRARHARNCDLLTPERKANTFCKFTPRRLPRQALGNPADLALRE